MCKVFITTFDLVFISILIFTTALVVQPFEVQDLKVANPLIPDNTGLMDGVGVKEGVSLSVFVATGVGVGNGVYVDKGVYPDRDGLGVSVGVVVFRVSLFLVVTNIKNIVITTIKIAKKAVRPIFKNPLFMGHILTHTWNIANKLKI